MCLFYHGFIKDREQSEIVYIYLESVCIYYLEFMFIFEWFIFISVGVGVYLFFLLFILGGFWDHPNFGSWVYIYSGWFAFIAVKFVFIISNFYLIYDFYVYSEVVCVYPVMGS